MIHTTTGMNKAIMISSPGVVRYGAYQGILRTRAFFISVKNQLPRNEAAMSTATIFSREITVVTPTPPFHHLPVELPPGVFSQYLPEIGRLRRCTQVRGFKNIFGANLRVAIEAGNVVIIDLNR